MAWGFADYVQAVVNPLGSTVDIVGGAVSASQDAREREAALKVQRAEAAAAAAEARARAAAAAGSSKGPKGSKGSKDSSGSSGSSGSSALATSATSSSPLASVATSLGVSTDQVMIGAGALLVLGATLYLFTRKGRR